MNWDWDKIKNTTDKYKVSKMRITKFKFLIKEIEPFIRSKKYIEYSTAGKWIDSETLIK